MDKKTTPKHSSYWLFFFVIFIALFLEIVSFPDSMELFRPDFITLALIFFTIFDPRRINFGHAWVCGLILDLLVGAPLGVNALICASQLYLIHSQFKRFSNYVIYQQALIILVINCIAHVAVYWLEHLLGAGNYHVNFLATALSTAIMWPFVALLLKFLCNYFSIVPFGAEQKN